MLEAGIVVPFYRHEQAIAGLVAALRPLSLRCWLVDDGSGPQSAAVLDQLAMAEAGWLRLLRHPVNLGKGAAVMTGFAAAASAGCTHAVQIDADHQHLPADIPRLLALASTRPDALITGIPVYDASVPKARLYGRYATHVWVWINTLSLEIHDSMCGFRVYPLASALAAWQTSSIGRRMEFDTEIMVRMHWAGVAVLGLPTPVTYPADGVSHFNLWRDNLRISWMHTRLFFGMLRRLPMLLARRRSLR